MENPTENAPLKDSLEHLLVVPERCPTELQTPCFSTAAASNIVYLSVCRTTGCDVMCITSTSQRFTEGKTHRKGPRMKGLAATIQYPSESSKLLGARTKMKVKTPADELTDDAVRERRNRELHQERDVFVRQVKEKQELKAQLERSSVIAIQRTWRGYFVRHTRRAESTGALPRHKIQTRSSNPPSLGDGSVALLIVPRIPITHAEIGEELRVLALELGLKPIPGLNLPMNRKKTKRERQQERDSALVIQSTWRMYQGKRIRWQLLEARKEDKRCRAALVVVQAWKRYRKRTQDPQRQHSAEAARNQVRYRAFAQKFHSKAAVRMVEHQRLADEAQEKMNQALKFRPITI